MKSAAVRRIRGQKRKNIFYLSCFLILVLSLVSPDLPAQQKPSVKLKVDPFYLQLFEDAKQSFNAGDYETAFQNFKLAAFGFLDEPDLLGEAFVYLTVTAYNLKKEDQVTHYLKEIMRFRLTNRISASPLPSELKKKFEKIQSDFKIPGNG